MAMLSARRLGDGGGFRLGATRAGGGPRSTVPFSAPSGSREFLFVSLRRDRGRRSRGVTTTDQRPGSSRDTETLLYFR
jgi:hypothetical protein